VKELATQFMDDLRCNLEIRLLVMMQNYLIYQSQVDNFFLISENLKKSSTNEGENEERESDYQTGIY